MRNSLLKTTVLSVCILLASLNANAQRKGDGAAAAIGAVAAIGAAALEVHLILELLETRALNYVIENHPEMQSFRLKVLDLDGKKLSDIGAMSVMTFRITELNQATGEELSRSVLMMYTSKGWMNSNGIDFSLVSWKMYSKEEWNDIFIAFVELNTPVAINRETFQYPESVKLKTKNYNPSDSLHYCLKDDCYQLNPNFMMNALAADFGRKGLITTTYDSYGYATEETTLPFYPMKNDDYLVADYSNEFKLFANEKSMGLFLKNTNESLQLQRSLVTTIHRFLNRGF